MDQLVSFVFIMKGNNIQKKTHNPNPVNISMIKSKNHASDKKLQAKTAMSILAQGAQFFLIAQNYHQGALELNLEEKKMFYEN